MEPSWHRECAQQQKSREKPVRWTPWALQVGGSNSTEIVKKRIRNLMFFRSICGSGFFGNLVATWAPLGAQNLPKMRPSRFPRGVQQALGKISKICTAPRRELDFQWIRAPNLAPKFIKNIFKNRSETDRLLGWVLDGS